MNLFNIYSRAAGVARAITVFLSAALVFLTDGTVAQAPYVAKIAVAITAAIQLLTRFTEVGNAKS